MINRKYNLKNLKYIREEFDRVLYFEGKYTSHVERADWIKMSAGATKSSLYGLFPPHPDVSILIDGTQLGKIVEEEKNLDFKYYFDKKCKLILIERFDPTSQYNDKLVNTVFIEYEKKRRINVLFCKGRTENIATVAECKLDLFGRLVRYVECTCGVNGHPYVYTIQRYGYSGNTVKVKQSVYSIWQDGEETKLSERKYVLKKGKLRETTK